MRRYSRIRSFLLVGLLAFVISPSTARAVSISLVPDGPTTIEIGETVNVDLSTANVAYGQTSSRTLSSAYGHESDGPPRVPQEPARGLS